MFYDLNNDSMHPHHEIVGIGVMRDVTKHISAWCGVGVNKVVQHPMYYIKG